tara:strand:- start:18 stop:356 length:339 start_codon:yes stop_codon:yes gene_type:complete
MAHEMKFVVNRWENNPIMGQVEVPGSNGEEMMDIIIEALQNETSHEFESIEEAIAYYDSLSLDELNHAVILYDCHEDGFKIFRHCDMELELGHEAKCLAEINLAINPPTQPE